MTLLACMGPDAESVVLQLEDRFGSPMLEEIEAFSRSFQVALEAELGEEAAGAISLEVSSPVIFATILYIVHRAVNQTMGTLLPGRLLLHILSAAKTCRYADNMNGMSAHCL